ncbi:hypothetical protein B0H11DRAFT_2186944 [Mycena galericulata]|nr:hypothetical protein B0H11DRAFT_2186944 [Mycena galericulata]
MSTHKDRIRLISVFNAPAGVSKHEFDHGFSVLVDSVVELPVAKKNITKYEVSYSNDQCDAGVLNLACPPIPSAGAILLIIETETQEEMDEFLNDPGLIKHVKDFHPPPVGIASHSFSFSADVVTKIEK